MAENNTIEITIPNQGLTVTEVVIIKWHKNWRSVPKRRRTTGL
ncbi:MAG: hypothetical protein WKG06_09890 [Segetibacter sp.]